MRKLLFITCCIGLLWACKEDSGSQSADSEVVAAKDSSNIDSKSLKLLTKVNPSQSGLKFTNQLTETEEYNVFSYEGFTQGGGVAILDFNNDGLQDVYLSANMGADKLFQNKGNLKFEDVTSASGIHANLWSTGAAVVDINNDGLEDIYVCQFLYDDAAKRANKFYINQGNGKFVDQAQQMGVADLGYSIMANFFDFDKDGDLDLYVGNQPPNSLKAKEPLKGKMSFKYTDRLYRNDNGQFTDVTSEAGIMNYTYTLSVTTFDYNNDGWTDIYIASDYDEPDLLYENQGNGTFLNKANNAIKHMSNFSMGVDIADINNDGFLDVYAVDMVAEDNFRQKTNMSGMNPEKFYTLAKNGYHYQYMFNALQVNNGNGTFSEIGQLAGISNTDWSWTPLFVDFDNDSYKDLIVTNGIIKETRNKDSELWRKDYYKELKRSGKTKVDLMALSQQTPSVKVSNYIYKNNGDLTFTKMNDAWGFEEPTWSNGAAYADFDNDGDLDLIINNANMNCSLFKNTAHENGLLNYLNVELEGNFMNAKIEINYGNGQKQFTEYSPYRGYMSTSQKIAHFGLANHDKVNELKVIWSNGQETIKNNISVNQSIKINSNSASSTKTKKNNPNPTFAVAQAASVEHTENVFNDFKREVLLPYRTSTLGPIVAEADINNDGYTDMYVGGSAGFPGALYINQNNRSFSKVETPFLQDKNSEDGGAHFFDADNDGDLDLYVSSGGSEYDYGDNLYRDRLYINMDGTNFKKVNALPALKESSGPVVSLDVDQDGDLDLFVGGRQVPGKYGRKPKSYILLNNKGKFTASIKHSAFTKTLGMVTDAKIGDVNFDGKDDLVVTGEWMPIMVFNLFESGAANITKSCKLENLSGWWNRIELADVNDDGFLDIIAGNLGKNIKYKASPSEPFKVYVDDFDKNGTHDVYLGYYQNGQCYPVRGRQCSSEQMPFIKKKFGSYEDFGLATIDKVLEDHISETTTVLEAQTFSNTIFFGGNNGFTTVELPNEAQMAPVYGIAVDDFDKDGKVEVFLCGNMYHREVETTRSDAGTGCLLDIDKQMNMQVSRSVKTGIQADKDVRNAAVLKGKSDNLLVIANNNAAAQIYKY